MIDEHVTGLDVLLLWFSLALDAPDAFVERRWRVGIIFDVALVLRLMYELA